MYCYFDYRHELRMFFVCDVGDVRCMSGVVDDDVRRVSLMLMLYDVHFHDDADARMFVDDDDEVCDVFWK